METVSVLVCLLFILYVIEATLFYQFFLGVLCGLVEKKLIAGFGRPTTISIEL